MTTGLHETDGSTAYGQLTLGHLMAGVAIAGLGLASCGQDWASTLSIILIGGMVLHFLRLPIIAGGPGIRGRLPWIVWGLSLAFCPVALGILDVVHEIAGPVNDVMSPSWEETWQGRLLLGLEAAHQAVSVAGSLMVIIMTRELFFRLVAWAIIGSSAASPSSWHWERAWRCRASIYDYRHWRGMTSL
jgi:hypothetical protein